MSMSNLSVDGEFRYIIQWFNEWSELQRDDFVYVLVEYLTRDSAVGVGGGGGGSAYVNGIVHSLATAAVQDKPMSLFQCRIKLFREWNPKWPSDFKCKLQEKINEIDPKVGEKIINELKQPHAMHNGDVSVHLNANGASGSTDDELEQSPVVAETLPSTAEAQPAAAAAAVANEVIDQTSETANAGQLAEVVLPETSVDDDEDNDEAQPQLQLASNDRNADTNGINASPSSSVAVTTIAVNASPAEEQQQQQQQQPQPQTQPQAIVEPVEQVENNVSASVIVSVSAAAEVVPVA
ncbi:hypothetical protein KR222_010552 [Zaprionus bogoriensis]|nr:hypothetical protein KR222_010552 [Zaprionus bogoriensis]